MQFQHVGLTVALSAAGYATFNFVANQLTPLILGFSLPGFFYILTGINLFAFFFVLLALPELKVRTYVCMYVCTYTYMIFCTM